MHNRSTNSDPDRHPVDLVAEEFAAQCRRGEHPSVSDYAARHPQWAEQLRELLPPIALMEKLKRRNTSADGAGSGSGSSAAVGSPPLTLERLGDFRIVREVGRGGMGIVYEAVQESLDRHVALKVLSRASLLDEQRVARFEQEARAAAGLHHTNIVPVFGVGEHEGLHYYVMQFIRGRSIGQVIAELAGKEHPGTPSAGTGASGSKDGAAASASASAEHELGAAPRGRRYWRWVAEVGRQVADALGYAHRQGVLHRDVKPGNLLLDERGNVWITDFGLAKLGELQSVTRTGDVIGTLQYLAPEGLKSHADARSDIYGLGVTLYEMLALRPAFEERSPAALMRRVAEGDLAPPRRANRHVPPDLETIVLKAVARDAGARYQSAAELAEDLENFLHDRPIAARRASTAERLWRWCRRNRAVAALGAAAMLCAAVAIVVGWAAYGVTRRALAAEAIKRGEAEAQRRRADENVALSLRSFEEIFNQLAPENEMPPPVPWMVGSAVERRGRPGGPDGPGGGGPGGGPGGGGPGGGGGGGPREPAQDAALLKSILSFYDRFAEQNATNPALEAEAAKAYRRVGDSYLRLGQPADADAAYRRSASMYAALLKASPESERYQVGLAEAAVWVGVEQTKSTTQSSTSSSDAQVVHRAAGLVDSLVKAHPDRQRYAELAARLLLREGDLLRQEGKPTEAEARYRQSAELWKQGGPPAPPPRGEGGGRRGPPPRPPEGYAAPLALAELLVDEKRIAEARAAVRAAMAELDQSPGGPAGRGMRMAAVYERLARVAEAAGEDDLAFQARQRAALRAIDGEMGGGGPGGGGGPRHHGPGRDGGP